MTNLTQSLKVILLAVVLSFGISYVFAWAPPTSAPTGGNSKAPLNTSLDPQQKLGGLVLDSLGIMNSITTALQVNGGGVFGGNVKLGYEAVICNSSVQGSMRYNSTSKKIEYCDSTAWKEISSSASSVATLSNSPNPIAVGQSTILAWLFTDTVSCTASGGWSGAKPFNGSQTINPTTTTLYTLSCVNSSGGTVTKTASVDVRQWTSTTGGGSYGQSCNAWLSATGQAGINGSTPALASKTNGAILSMSNGSSDYCIYQAAPRGLGTLSQWAYPSSYASVGWKPVAVGSACGSGNPECNYDGYVVKTRR